MFLDSKLDFSEQLKTIFQKTNRAIGLLRKLETLLPRAPFITIYELFIRPLLDYVDVIYDQTFSMSFQQKMETIQDNAALAITGAIRGSSKQKLYQELGLDTLQQLCWNRKLHYFYKIVKSQSLKYLYRIILSFIRPSPNSTFNCHSPKGIKLLSQQKHGLSHLREHKLKQSF